jgi:hypothetical protein
MWATKVVADWQLSTAAEFLDLQQHYVRPWERLDVFAFTHSLPDHDHRLMLETVGFLTRSSCLSLGRCS